MFSNFHVSKGLEMYAKSFIAAGTAAMLSASIGTAAMADEVNIYSYRQPNLIAPLLDAFTEETGIKTNVLFLNKGLVERVAAEGANSPADLILTVDISRLDDAKDKGVTQPVEDNGINGTIPANFRDPEGHWFGLTTRGRVVYASKDRVPQDTITYEELADSKWKGKICIRSGQHIYNIGIIASIIANLGGDKAEAWLSGVKNNLARKPNGNDRAQAQGRLCRRMLHRYRQHLLCRPDENQRKGVGTEGMGERHQGAVPEFRGPRHPCQHFRHGAGQERSQQGRRH